MERTEHEVAGDESAAPRWWAMPYPTEPLYPVDFFVAAKGRRRGARFRLADAPANDAENS